MALDRQLLLSNETILLRPIEEKDKAELQEICQNENLWKYFTQDLSVFEELEKWMNPALAGERLQLMIIDNSSGKILGSSGFGNYSLRDERVEVGWTWIISSHHGTGLNDEVKGLMLNYAFEVLKVKRVEFKTDVLNMAARKALKNLGAIEEGVLRSHTLMTKGRRRDTIYYSILIEEWPHVKRENDW
ncbi:GNAT family N-acetyltransferase [Belliella kenyensis]|uniref:GNAT family N-acetyltransferase n=1 Tax=Belliella kenyensis TaxID=1472724 RepID=A0ABV8EN06_9BACT|nr:GNAT family protein [Belliella kenyensis]MCH7403180.1 GNAT family N-acetyltransferase [Belliella kenyensis]MDN3604791.1 GNAT family protein [Belliella kenyensis]